MTREVSVDWPWPSEWESVEDVSAFYKDRLYPALSDFIGQMGESDTYLDYVQGPFTIANLTIGSVLFASTGGIVSQDNDDFFWDATNIRLGINVGTSPSVTLDLAGDTKLDGAVTVNNSQADKDFLIKSDDDAAFFFINSNDNLLGIREGTPTALVHITALNANTVPALNLEAGANGEIVTPDGQTLRMGHWDGSSTFTERLKMDASGIWYVSYLSTGSVVFAGSGGELKQDNAKFFWDDTQDQLALGHGNPSNILHVSGVGTVSGWGGAYGGVVTRFHCTESKHTSIVIDALSGYDGVLGFSENGVAMWDIRNDASATDTFNIRYQVGAANATRLAIDNSGHFDFQSGNMVTLGTLGAGNATLGTVGCNEITVADGHGINLQEDITFTGATTENLIKIPDHLAVALDITEAGNSYLKFVTTNSGEKVVFGKLFEAPTACKIGNLTLGDGSITDSSNAINFGNEALSTTGTFSAGSTTVTGLNVTGAGSPGIEVRSTNGGTPFIDFSNDAGVDYDVRLILVSDNLLQCSGGAIAIIDTSENNPTFKVQGTTTGTSGSFYGMQFFGISNPSSGSTLALRGVEGLGQIQAGNAQDITGSVFGGQIAAIHGGTGTLAEAMGIRTYIHNDSTGTITAAYGINIYSLIDAGSTIETYYGLYHNVTDNGTVNTGWFLYDTTGYSNYLAGNTGIGQTTFGTNAAKVLALGTGVAPTSSPADCFQMYSADIGGTAGEAGVHFRDEEGNIVSLGSGGIITTSNARVVRDLWLNAGAIRAPGSDPATQIAHGALETPAWQFGNEIEANEETISLNIKFPNDMDKSVAPLMCVGWSTTTQDPGDNSEQAEWQLEYLYTQLNEATNAAAEETLYTTSSASTTAEGLVVSTWTGMNVPNANDVCIHCRIKRLSAAAAGSGDDSIADDVEVHGIVMQYTSNKQGTAT